MTTPVDADDIVQGAVKWLQNFPDVRAVLGGTDSSPWLFQHQLWVVAEGTQSTAAVIIDAGGWGGPNPHNTMRFPRLSLEISADPIRDAGNNIIDPGEVNRRIKHAYRVIDAHLHRPQGGEQWWGQIRTIGCTRLIEPSVYPVPAGGGLLRLTATYAVTEA